MSLQLDNLFNGNKALGDNMNVFINENWEVIFQELKPAVRDTLIKIVSGLINDVFATLPYKEWFIAEQ
jgi:Haemolymph juvenile hormone binding protein (JHBP)